jgi:hypothetical protein
MILRIIYVSGFSIFTMAAFRDRKS